MTNIYELLETDTDAEEDGIWVEISDGVRVKIASTDSKRYREKVVQLLKPYRKILQAGGRIPEAKQEQIAIESIVDGLLLDWKGITDRGGKTMKFNRENALKVITELKKFRELISEIAGEAETFNKHALEDAAKNSPAPSAGTSAGATAKPESSSETA